MQQPVRALRHRENLFSLRPGGIFDGGTSSDTYWWVSVLLAFGCPLLEIFDIEVEAASFEAAGCIDGGGGGGKDERPRRGTRGCLVSEKIRSQISESMISWFGLLNNKITG